MTPPNELEKLAEDWITLWQSELGALAADPELAEAWAAAVALGAAWWRAQAAGMSAGAAAGFQMPVPGAFGGSGFAPWGWPPAWPPAPPTPWAGQADVEPGPDAAQPGPPAARADAQAGPAPPADAPDGQRDAGGGGAGPVEPAFGPDATLAARLAELERRLAEIEGGPGGAPADPPAPRRRKRKS